MVLEYYRCLINFSFLTLYSPPAKKKITGSPFIRQVLKANWLCPPSFVGESGKGVERTSPRMHSPTGMEKELPGT